MLGKIGGLAGAALGGMVGGPAGAKWGYALGSAASTAIEQNRRDNVAQDAATTAFERQQLLRQTSYQDTMADLRAAGLNPMLAFSQGPTSTPGVAQASLPYVAPASIQAEAASVSSAASARQVELNENMIDAQVKKIASEINKIDLEAANLPEQQRVLKFTVQQLAESAAFMAQQGESQVVIRKHLEAMVDKLKVETSLGEVDLRAVTSFGELGKTVGALEPFLRLVWNALVRR